jgi:hypothetical protein
MSAFEPRKRLRSGRLLLALALLWLPGCAAIEHGMSAKEVAGRPLSLRGAEGRQRLGAEAALDSTVKAWLREHPKPDYLYVESRMRIYLFYLKPTDRVVMFERDLTESRVSDLGRIPGSLLRMLPAGEAERVVASRKASMQRAKAKQAREWAARPAPAPAAAAPSGTYFGSFDVSAISERMREQRTAADPGVRSWRRTKLEDGRQRLFAKLGGTRYEVRPDAVTVATAASAKTRGLTRSMRMGLARVNRAVFPHKGDAVTETMLPFAKQVMADVSGRTRVARRVAGRTIRIERRPSDGLVVYSIQP